MLYDQLFVSMERARWDLGRDIDFGEIERDRLSPGWIQEVREVAASQLASLGAAETFLGDFRTDIDFCSFISVWFYEEMEHHLVLRKYLGHLGECVEETELPRHRLSPEGAPAIEMLTLRLVGEQRVAQRYATLGVAAPEPVLRRILSALAAGEARHAAAYATYLRRAVERDPAALPGVLRLALWAMRADEPAPPSLTGQPADAGSAVPPAATPREDRHGIRRMQALYRLLIPDSDRVPVPDEELQGLRQAAAVAP